MRYMLLVYSTEPPGGLEPEEADGGSRLVITS